MTSLNLDPEVINLYYPIYGVTAYGKVLILHRGCQFPPPKSKRKGNRKKIKETKKKSLDLLCFKVSTCGINFLSMCTLTYGQNYPLNGPRVKADINYFLTEMKRSLDTFSYFWFLEFQRRGAPHIHIVWTLPKPDNCQRELMALVWSKIAEQGNWPYTEIKAPYDRKLAGFGMNTQDSVFRQHRREKVWSGLRKKDGAIRYALQYAKKEYQKKVPQHFSNVGRFWATSTDVAPKGGIQVPMKETEVRELLESLGRKFENWKLLPKVIFHS